MDVASKLAVAILGYGFMGLTHLLAWRLIEGCEVVGVWGRDYSRLKNFCEKYDVRPIRDLDRLLRDESVNIVDVCTPTYTHREFVVMSVEAGKNVIVEKPIALSIQEADEMISKSRRHGVKFMVAHVLRFFPDYMRVKDLVEQHAVGSVASMRAHRVGPAPSWSSWFLDRSKSGGVVIDLAIHDIDYFIWVKKSMPISVYSKVANLVHKDYEVDDYALITMRFPDGAIGFVEASWAMPQTFPFTMKLEIIGDKGMLQLDNHSPVPLRMWTSKGEETFSPESLQVGLGGQFLPLDPFYRELSYFARCVREDLEVEVGGEEAKKSLLVAIAALKSAQSNAPVAVGG